jgi:hypothetical protein
MSTPTSYAVGSVIHVMSTPTSYTVGSVIHIMSHPHDVVNPHFLRYMTSHDAAGIGCASLGGGLADQLERQRMRTPSPPIGGRGLHSSNFRLNIIAFCGIGIASRGCSRGCSGGVQRF